MFYLKYLILSFICFSSLAETAPSFTFSEEEGLKPLTKKESEEKLSSSKTDNSTVDEEKSQTKDVQKAKIKKTEPLEANRDSTTNKIKSSDKYNTESQAVNLKKDSSKKNLNVGPTGDNLSNSSLNKEEEKATQESISESFAPQKEKKVFSSTDWAKTLFQDTSWFFQKKQTKHKIAFVPIYSYDRTEDSRIGLRLFSFSPVEKGYYFAFSGAKYWPKNYYSSNLTYKSQRNDVFRSELSFIYDDHYENHYGSLTKFEGMEAPLDELKKLESHRMMIDYNLFYQEQEKPFYLGAGARVFYKKERKDLQEGKSHFEDGKGDEWFIFLRAFAGMDTRDNWKYPKKGVFHQASFGCKAILDSSSAYCQTQGDIRFYRTLPQEIQAPDFIKNSVFSLRAFYGTSLISSSSYATKYSLGGEGFFQQLTALRGFKNRRFLGDKMYLGQSEMRVPVWKEYLILAFFLEMGEVAQLGDSFSSFVTNYGGGVRIGWPRDSGMKLRFDYSTGRDRQNKKNTDFIISFLQAF